MDEILTREELEELETVLWDGGTFEYPPHDPVRYRQTALVLAEKGRLAAVGIRAVVEWPNGCKRHCSQYDACPKDHPFPCEEAAQWLLDWRG